MSAVAVGQKRLNGAVSFTVVKVDKKFVYVKRSDEPKKSLADASGAHSVPLSVFEQWAQA